MLKPARALVVPLMAAAAVGLLTASADAKPRRGGIIGYVMAESFYGPATATGPVRVGPYGRLEVGLPGGTWLECGQSCSNTLRRNTVDFWEAHQQGRGGDGVGYLRLRR